MHDPRLMLRPRLAISLPGWGGVAALIAASAFAAYQSYEATGLLARTAVKREQAEAVKVKMAQTVARLSPDQIRHWQTLGAHVAYPWNSFFQAVERTASENIELLEMAPDKARRQMVLRGEASNNIALVKYVQALAAQAGLRDVFIARMQNIERGELLTVEFEVRMVVI